MNSSTGLQPPGDAGEQAKGKIFTQEILRSYTGIHHWIGMPVRGCEAQDTNALGKVTSRYTGFVMK